MTRLSRLLPAALLGLGLASPAAVAPAWAQQGQEWFVPGQGQQQPRPPAAAQPAPAQPPRPAAQPAQPPAQPRPPQPQAGPRPLPPGQPPPAALIGIVDIPEVQRVSTAFNSVREEIERRRARLNDDLQREQNAWREAQQQLATQRASLTPDQVRTLERQLQDRITDSQRIFRNRSQAIEAAAQQAVMQIEEGLANVVRQVAQSRQVNIVLPRPLVIMNEPAFDLTEEVAQQFNRQLRTVTLPPEGDGSSPPVAAQPPPPTPRQPAAAAQGTGPQNRPPPPRN